jgi:acyl carrier protein
VDPIIEVFFLNTRDFLQHLLVTEFGVRADRITPEATLDSMGLDSLATVELVAEIEREYDIALTVEQARFQTFGEALATLDALLEQRPA